MLKNLDDLLGHKIQRTMLELTRECNLRCVYCAVSQPFWIHKSMDLDDIKLSSIIDHLKSVGNKQIVMQGHGETTIVPKWDEYARLFLDNGFQLITCTNLAKSFSDVEIETLAKFVSITASIDTADPEKFAKLRRGARLDKFVSNFTRIKEAGFSGTWNFSCVLCKETIDDIKGLLFLGLDLGVNVFSFCNLTKIGGVELTHLAELNQREAREAYQKLIEARDICIGAGVYFDVKGGLLEALEQACR